MLETPPKNGKVALAECEAQSAPLVALKIHGGGGGITMSLQPPTNHDMASLKASAMAIQLTRDTDVVEASQEGG